LVREKKTGSRDQSSRQKKHKESILSHARKLVISQDFPREISKSYMKKAKKEGHVTKPIYDKLYSEAPLLSKFDNLSSQAILVVT